MNSQHFMDRRAWWVGPLRLVCLALLCGSLAVPTAPAIAAEEDEYGNALDWVPADASAFSMSLKLKEQIQVVAESNAWKAFKEIPTIQMGWQMAEMQINNPEGPAAMFWQLMELPENQQLVKLLGEMFSDEIAFYAGADFEKTLELFSVFQGSRFAPMLAAIEGDAEAGQTAQLEMVLAAIEEDPSLLNVPDMVFAFRIEDAEAATTQLKRLEVLANMGLQQSPLDAKVEREEIGESEFIVLKLDGSMIPWEDEAPAGFPLDDEAYEKLKETVSEKELAIALGEWNGYLLLSIGDSTEHLAELGGDGELLADSEKFEYLEEHLEEEVVGVQYVSEKLMAYQYATAEDLDAFAAMIDESLEESEELPDELKERISEDLPELANDFKKYLPKPGAMVGCTLLTDSGFESFSYSWAQQAQLDASKPLEIVQHLGGSPLMAVAGRGKSDPEDYGVFAKWCGKAIEYFEDFALAEMDEDERAKAEKALEIARPLLKRLNETTRDHLVPALADGQSAIVFDADIKSKKWHEEMPESHNELPMLELAVAMGVSDVEEFKQAMREYKEIADDAVDAIREADPEAIPEDYEIPDPETESTSAGTVYTWSLNELELDDQIALCGGVSDAIAVFATSPALAERVLEENTLESTGEALADGEEPRALVAGIDFAGLVDAAAPWVHYAIRASAIDEAELSQDPEDDPQQVQDIASQVQSGLEILKCFRGAWAETSEDEGVWVTHSVAVFEDLEADESEESEE